MAPRTTLIATSSSGILISDIPDAAVCPERVVAGLDSELAGVDLGDIVAPRDQLLLGLLQLKA
jgi:hypothetical protein